MKIAIATSVLSLIVALPGNAQPNLEKNADLADITAIADGSNEFGLKLYAELANKPGNVVVSPWSISTALAMAHAGARGETATEMRAAMSFPFDGARLHRAYQATIAGLNAEADNELNVANAMFVQDGYALLDDFVSVTRDHYAAESRALDFENASEASRLEMNEWVEDRTKDRIKDLFPRGTVTSLTRLVLANAVYFKGAWAAPFSERRTRETDFHLADGGSVKVQLMRRTDPTAYFRGDGFQAADIAYEGDRLSMLVLLPDEHDGLPELEARLSTDLLDTVVDGLSEISLPLWLPRFEVSGDFGLSPTLNALGMKRALTREADLSGMNGKQDLYVQAVRHKAWMKVDEKGTEAAAATGMVFGAKSEPTTVFRADHPFVFAIRDRESGAILFMGRLAIPE